MASNPLAVPMLVGLGISELSGTPSAVPLVKEIIRELDFGDVEADVRRAPQTPAPPPRCTRSQRARLRDAGLLEHPDIGPWLRTVVDKSGSRANDPALVRGRWSHRRGGLAGVCPSTRLPAAVWYPLPQGFAPWPPRCVPHPGEPIEQ